jgi:hypothetical protein
MKLDAEKVHSIVVDSLWKEHEVPDGKPPANGVVSQGIMNKFCFHPERLESHRAEVSAMLAELPDQFHKSKGGGWTFLNGCMDRDGNQWGEQMNVDELVVLGQALRLARYQMPREMWSMFPGGMPYFEVSLDPPGNPEGSRTP